MHKHMMAVLAAASMATTTAFAEGERVPMPKVIEWQGHYLILQGENFLPVKTAFATPNLSLFQVEKDYVPSNSYSGTDQKSTCEGGDGSGPRDAGGGRSVTDTGVVSDMAEAAIAQAGEAERMRHLHCPKSLGTVYGAGSYVFDGDGNDLAGQDFKEPVTLWNSRFMGGDEYEDPRLDDVIVVFEGGKARGGDPAVKVFNYDDAVILDYPVLRREGEEDGKKKQKPGEDYIPPAPDLPVTVGYSVLGGDNHVGEPIGTLNDELERVGELPLDVLLAGLPDVLPKPANGKDAEGDVLIVARGTADGSQDELEDRLDAIEKKINAVLGAKVKVRTIAVGQELPLCVDDTVACWAMNRSTILYHDIR